jgi:redox-sensitive bicupin YhaK (pirin superfamily)
MLTLRKSDERGHFNHGWLNTYHSFSFASYYERSHMGYRALRVINEDRVQPGRGFAAHDHADMEIITYILEGALEHKDSMGNGSVIRRGDVQRMSAGTGITHSEFNPSPKEAVHLLQIWIFPEKDGLKPEYEQKTFSDDDKLGRLRLIASRYGRDGSVAIHQDVDLYASILEDGAAVSHEIAPGRFAWLQATAGQLKLNGQVLKTGDGAALNDETRLAISAHERSEFLLFDLA